MRVWSRGYKVVVVTAVVLLATLPIFEAFHLLGIPQVVPLTLLAAAALLLSFFGVAVVVKWFRRKNG